MGVSTHAGSSSEEVSPESITLDPSAMIHRGDHMLCKLRYRKFRRLMSSLAGSGFTFLGLVIGAFSILAREQSLQDPWVIVIGGGVSCLGIAFWILQARFESARKANDPTWALKFQDVWDKSKSTERPLAAKTLLAYENRLSEVDTYDAELSNIDDVLDILESIGFYVENDQISLEVACHHFDYWIRRYWCAAHVYVQARRKQRGVALWRHIEPLFQATAEVNRFRKAKPLTQAQVRSFLEEEVRGGAALKAG